MKKTVHKTLLIHTQTHHQVYTNFMKTQGIYQNIYQGIQQGRNQTFIKAYITKYNQKHA